MSVLCACAKKKNLTPLLILRGVRAYNIEPAFILELPNYITKLGRLPKVPNYLHLAMQQSILSGLCLSAKKGTFDPTLLLERPIYNLLAMTLIENPCFLSTGSPTAKAWHSYLPSAPNVLSSFSETFRITIVTKSFFNFLPSTNGRVYGISYS